MARRFAKVSEEEIKTAFFYPSDLVNTKTTTPPPPGSVKSGGYIPRREASGRLKAGDATQHKMHLCRYNVQNVHRFIDLRKRSH